MVRFEILCSRNSLDRKLQPPRQLPADPMQRVQPWTPTRIFPAHLPHNDVPNPNTRTVTAPSAPARIAAPQAAPRTRQHYYLAAADPLRDASLATRCIFYDHADAGWPGAAVRTPVNIRYQPRNFTAHAWPVLASVKVAFCLRFLFEPCVNESQPSRAFCVRPVKTSTERKCLFSTAAPRHHAKCLIQQAL